MKLINADEIRIKPEYMYDICGSVMIRVEDMARIINEIPPASTNSSESPNGWMPCTPNTMPEEYQDVLVTLSDNNGSFVKEMQYIKGLFETDGDLYGVVDEKDSVDCADSYKAIAWQKLPEPYQAESEE